MSLSLDHTPIARSQWNNDDDATFTTSSKLGKQPIFAFDLGSTFRLQKNIQSITSRLHSASSSKKEMWRHTKK